MPIAVFPSTPFTRRGEIPRIDIRTQGVKIERRSVSDVTIALKPFSVAADMRQTNDSILLAFQ